jgi:hypothetical protein
MIFVYTQVWFEEQSPNEQHALFRTVYYVVPWLFFAWYHKSKLAVTGLIYHALLFRGGIHHVHEVSTEKGK